MKRLVLLVAMGSVVLGALAAAGCGNSVDAAGAPTPTPTDNPTPTPTPGDLSGTYTVSPQTATVYCNGGLPVTFGANHVDITVSGGDFTPSWGFVPTGSFSVPEAEHGTITGDDFVANYTYCSYTNVVGENLTTKYVATWTGTFHGDGTFDSTLSQKLVNATGNLTANCGIGIADPSVTGNMTDCTSPGISWAIHGVIQ